MVDGLTPVTDKVGPIHDFLLSMPSSPFRAFWGWLTLIGFLLGGPECWIPLTGATTGGSRRPFVWMPSMDAVCRHQEGPQQGPSSTTLGSRHRSPVLGCQRPSQVTVEERWHCQVKDASGAQMSGADLAAHLPGYWWPFVQPPTRTLVILHWRLLLAASWSQRVYILHSVS